MVSPGEGEVSELMKADCHHAGMATLAVSYWPINPYSVHKSSVISNKLCTTI